MITYSENKTRFINLVRNRFFQIRDFDLEIYSHFINHFLKRVADMNDEDTDLTPFFCLFSNLALSSIELTERTASNFDVEAINFNEQKLLDCKKAADTAESAREWSTVIKSPFGTFRFSAQALNLIRQNKTLSVSIKGKGGKACDTLISLLKTDSFPERSRVRIIEYEIKSNSEFWNEFAERQYCGICYNLSKSLTIGEYIALDRYSATRLNVILSRESTKEERKYIPLVKDLMDRIRSVVSVVSSFSKTIGLLLENTVESGKQHRPVRVEGLRHHIPYSYADSAVTDNYRMWANTIEAICAISYIDFFYISSPENLETLSSAYRRLEYMDDKGYDDIVEPNKFKALLLAKKCIETHTPVEEDKILEHKYLFHDLDFAELIKNIIPPENAGDSDTFSSDYTTDKIDGHYDITLFNRINYSYLQKKARQKNVRSVIDENDCSDAGIDEIAKSLDWDLWTVSLLTSAITFLSNAKLKDAERHYTILNRLLDILRALITQYDTEALTPGKIRLPFNKSFYVIEDGRMVHKPFPDYSCFEDIEKTFKNKQYVFIASGINTGPVFVNFLKLFIGKYELKLKKLEQQTEKETLKAQQGEMEKTLKAQQGEMEKTLKTQQKKMEDRLRSQQGHSLQLLGILGTFIAFVSLAASSLTSIEPELFWCHMVICTICLVILILMIFFIYLDNGVPKCVLCALLIGWVVFGTIKVSARHESPGKDCSCASSGGADVTLQIEPGGPALDHESTAAPVIFVSGQTNVISASADTAAILKNSYSKKP